MKRRPVDTVTIYRGRDGWRFRTRDAEGNELKDGGQAFRNRYHAERIARGRYPYARVEIRP